MKKNGLRAMRIVELLHGDKPGGMEKFCIDLSNMLAHKHEVMLIAHENFRKYANEAVDFVPLDVERSRNDPFFLYELYRTIKGYRADIVHAHKQNSISILKRLSYFWDIPFVATKHDMQRKKAFYGLRYAVAISEEVKRTVDAKEMRLIYNGIVPQKPKKIALPGRFNIVAVGGLRPVKGFDKLIDAVAALDREVHLTIIGEGEERTRLEKQIDALGVSDKVTLAGFKENVCDYLYSCDMQVIASYSEGFSLAMVEGVFYAPVLISTPVSGATEILSEDLIVSQKDLAKKIDDVMERYDRYRNETETIKRVWAPRLTIQACADAYSDFFDIIVRSKKKESSQ